jgi:hypothetical protein
MLRVLLLLLQLLQLLRLLQLLLLSTSGLTTKHAFESEVLLTDK